MMEQDIWPLVGPFESVSSPVNVVLDANLFIYIYCGTIAVSAY